MRLAIDFQPCQSETATRGIGRYALGLAQGIDRNLGQGDELVCLLNDNYEEELASLQRIFGHRELSYYRYPVPDVFYGAKGDFKRPIARELICQKYNMVQADAILLPNNFDGMGMRKSVIMNAYQSAKDALIVSVAYDLIPMVIEDRYHKNIFNQDDWYRHCLEALKSSDLILSISESTREDLAHYLKIPRDRIVNIYGTTDSMFHPVTVKDREALLKKMGISREFLLYTGAGIFHKNVSTLIMAYARMGEELRRAHQLVIVYDITQSQRREYGELAKCLGLDSEDVVFTGYISDEELVALYNLCKLFVFPSRYEGLGLPVLEAMQCGAPVIGANNSSIKELILHKEAMFDADEEDEMAMVMEKALRDDDYRARLRDWGSQRCKEFSWDRSAKTAISAIRDAVEERKRHLVANQSCAVHTREGNPRIAMVLPAGKVENPSCRDFLERLCKYYPMDLYLSPGEFSALKGSLQKEDMGVYSYAHLSKNGARYGVILYSMGNSREYIPIYRLAQSHPGIVILHDFFLGNLVWEATEKCREIFSNVLLSDHGMRGILAYHDTSMEEIIHRCAMNKHLLDASYGAVFFDGRFPEFYERQYGKTYAEPVLVQKEGVSAEELAASYAAFIRQVLDSHVLDNRNLMVRKTARLLAGCNAKKEDVEEIARCYRWNHRTPEIRRVIGCLDKNKWEAFLSSMPEVHRDNLFLECVLSKDIKEDGVRVSMENGETVFLPFHYGDFVIAGLEDDFQGVHRAVSHNRLRFCLLADNFEQVSEDNLEDVYGVILPDKCAEEATMHPFVNVLRKKHIRIMSMDDLWEQLPIGGTWKEIPMEAACVSEAEVVEKAPLDFRCASAIYVDLTYITRQDLGTGIQRVVRNVFRHMYDLEECVCPVRNASGCLVENHRYLGSSMGRESEIQFKKGDVLFLPDSSWEFHQDFQSYLNAANEVGVPSYGIVYDLIPLMNSDTTGGAGLNQTFQGWHHMLFQKATAVVCISRTVADIVARYCICQGFRRREPLQIYYFHMGSDIVGRSSDEDKVRSSLVDFLHRKKTFLMVGTVEPRKGHLVALQAFRKLQEKEDVQLLILGKDGWKNDAIKEEIRKCSLDSVLWIRGANDDELVYAYQHATALLAASQTEGFGLPLVEAAAFGLPIICSDIPVLHEVAGEYATYFHVMDSMDLERTMEAWLKEEQHPDTRNIRVYSWKESAMEILEIIQGKMEPYRVVEMQELERKNPALLVDVTEISGRDSGTGIQRVVRSVFKELCQKEDFFLPIRSTRQGMVMTGFSYQNQLLHAIEGTEQEGYVKCMDGDRLFLLDASWDYTDSFSRLLDEANKKGIPSYGMVYDLLLLFHPEWSVSNLFYQVFKKWHDMVLSKATDVICISRCVADTVRKYVSTQGLHRKQPLRIHYVHMGTDLIEVEASDGCVRDEIREFVEAAPTFLMVGTLEVRKGHGIVLDAMEGLMPQGNVQLLIIGHDGWKAEAIKEKVGKNRENVLWIKDASDEELHWAYQHSRALIAASQDEGFGLPLIEAAQFGLPIICSDIAVFREVTQGYATYFDAMDAKSLRETLENWLKEKQHPDSSNIKIYRWKECAEEIDEILKGMRAPYIICR